MGVRRLVATAAAVVLVLGLGGQRAVAVPPPPPNPSDAEIGESTATVDARATRVGQLTNEVAKAEALLMAMRAEAGLKLEDANKAIVDLRMAEDAVVRAMADAQAADLAADLAAADVDNARRALDEFAASSYRQGSTLGSLSAYLGATSPRDVLDRAQLLNALADSELDSLDDIEVARTAKANKDSAARAALAVADDQQARARQAKAAADTAVAAAQRAQRDQVAETARIEALVAQAEQRLVQAQAEVGGLETQRQRYQEWLAAKQREDEAAALALANAQAADAQETAEEPVQVSAPQPAPTRPSAPVSVNTVINRALSQQGVPYAWGGGDADGPTRGIRDGGVADAHGDYNKIGFDCSGLMIYAFAAAGVTLPHYSGYQHEAGRKVPLSQKRPGDMLFWATGGRIHHVALYLGSGQMVEAPYSGSHVRVTSVRYGGIVSQVTRLL
ncbi:NlpC/P60 family protein [Actinophytocola sediminis]